MDYHQATMEEMVQKLEKLERSMKQKRQRRDIRSTSSSTNLEESDMEAFYPPRNLEESDMEAFYPPSRERRKRRFHKTKHGEKLFKHNVRFLEFNGDLDRNVYFLVILKIRRFKNL